MENRVFSAIVLFTLDDEYREIFLNQLRDSNLGMIELSDQSSIAIQCSDVPEAKKKLVSICSRFEPKADPRHFVKMYASGALAFYKHPDRKCNKIIEYTIF